MKAPISRFGGAALASAAVFGALSFIAAGRLARVVEEAGRAADGAVSRLEAGLARDAEAARQADGALSGRLDEVSGALAVQSRRLDNLALRVSDLGRSASLSADSARDGTAAGDLAACRAYAAGREAFSEGRYADGAALFSEVLRLRGGDRDAERWEAACRFYANPLDSSSYARLETCFRAALSDNPADALALGVLARLSMERGEWPRAVEYFERLAASGRADAEDLSAAARAAAWASP